MTSTKESISRREFLARAERGAAGACLALSGVSDALGAADERPNFIFILTDDQRYDAIGEIGKLRNTVIIFAGDNGYFLGEHGLWDKRFAYEEAMRIPLAVYFPKTVKPGTVRDEMVLNIDLAPTLLDLAGLPVPSYMQGRSFKPLLEGRRVRWRDDFLYHYHLEVDLAKMPPEKKEAFMKLWKGMDPGPLFTPENMAVRTREWKYITYPGIDEIDELYDLRKDPYEMKNLASDPKYGDVVRKMKKRLDQLVEETR